MWVGGSATHINPPPPGLVPGGNGVVDHLSVFNDFPSQVRDFSHGLRAQPSAADPTSFYLALAITYLFRVFFVELMFDFAFVSLWLHN